MCAINVFMTWRQAPKKYEDVVAEAPALVGEYQDAPAYSPLRESGAHVAKTAYFLEKLSTIQFHRRWERLPILFSAWVAVAVISATLMEAVPTFLIESNVPTIQSVKPYTPLEVLGRDIYIEEGCYNCHSQMIRPMRHETERYGEYSKAGEFIYDRPFQWGSRRIGPDLHRVGGRYSHLWHYRHFEDPPSMTPRSIMPAYVHLLDKPLDFGVVTQRVAALAKLGAPYSEAELVDGEQLARAQANQIALEMEEQGGPAVAETEDRQVIALIAYLQRLGTDISRIDEEPAPADPAPEGEAAQQAAR
jgi:cytochrome c oxidase cbb3-type subunit I/II